MQIIDTTNLDTPSTDLLDTGTAGAPKIGDLWMLQRDDQDLGLVLLGYIQDTYVSVLPVTLDATLACIGAAVVPQDSSPFNTEIVVWATAPNSIGKHLLSRRIASICNETDIRKMILFANGEDVESSFSHNTSTLDEDRFSEVELVFNTFANLADDEWISSEWGEVPLNPDVLASRGLTPGALAELLGVPPQASLQLFHGDKIPSKDQIEAIHSLADIPDELLLDSSHSMESIALSQPEFKMDVLRLAQHFEIDEYAARNRILRDSYALAARQPRADQTQMARQKVRNSINRLMNECQGDL